MQGVAFSPAVRGEGRVVARASGAHTVLAHAHATSPLRFISPTFPGATAAVVCLVTFGGGLVDGDSLALDVVVEHGATLLVVTQATTKIFRGTSAQRTRARVDGTLVFLPDPVAAFEGASYTQSLDVDLGPCGALVSLDGITAGRPAFGDRWAFDRLSTRTTVRREGRLLARDALRLDPRDGPIAPRLAQFDALATLLVLGSAPLARSVLDADVSDTRVARGPLAEDGAIARIAARRPEHAIQQVRRHLRNLPEIGVVDPFASRP